MTDKTWKVSFRQADVEVTVQAVFDASATAEDAINGVAALLGVEIGAVEATAVEVLGPDEDLEIGR